MSMINKLFNKNKIDPVSVEERLNGMDDGSRFMSAIISAAVSTVELDDFYTYISFIRGISKKYSSIELFRDAVKYLGKYSHGGMDITLTEKSCEFTLIIVFNGIELVNTTYVNDREDFFKFTMMIAAYTQFESFKIQTLTAVKGTDL